MRMFFGLCCAGVEHGYSDQRQGEGQVETCRADGPRVAKGGREAWTEGPVARGSAVVADSLGQRRAKTCGHGVAWVEDLGTRVDGRGARAVHPLYGSVWWLSHRKTTEWTVSRFGPQNLGADGFRVWATKLGLRTVSRFGPQNLGAAGF